MGYLPYQLVSRISSINSTSTLQCGLIRHVNFKATFGVLWKTHQFFYCKTYDFRLENNIGPTIPFPQIFYKRSKGPSVIFQHKKKHTTFHNKHIMCCTSNTYPPGNGKNHSTRRLGGETPPDMYERNPANQRHICHVNPVNV